MKMTAASCPSQSTLENGTTPPTAGAFFATVAGPCSGCNRMGRGPDSGGRLFVEEAAFIEFTLLAGIERADRAVVAHYAGPYFAACALTVGRRLRGLFEDGGSYDGSLMVGGTCFPFHGVFHGERSNLRKARHRPAARRRTSGRTRGAPIDSRAWGKSRTWV
jgi:hypothetical protein